MADVTPGFSSTYVLAVLKECYEEKDVQNLIERGCPTLAKIKKVPGYGKYYVIPFMYTRGGAVTGDFSQINTLISNTAGNASAKVTFGQAFSGCTVTPKEHLASENGGGKGAFVSFLREYYYASTEALRRTIGAAIFGMGYGEVAPVTAVDAVGFITITMKSFGQMALDIGSYVVFATGPTPDGALRSTSAVKVSSINDNGNDTVTITFESQYVAAVAVGDWACIAGFRNAANKPLLFVGLRGWLPTIGNRTGGTWTAYIATDFFGINRSLFPSRLAGGFILRDNGGGEKYSAAIVRGVRAARRAGAVPDMIVLNDVDFGTVIGELQTTSSLFQKINGPDAASKVAITSGISSLMFAFSNTWVDYVIDDPFCPQGYAYILESDSVRMAMLSNAKVIEQNIPSTGENATPAIASQPMPPMEYRWNIDDLVATAPADTSDGQGTRVTTQFFGAFIVRNPAHNVVVKLDVASAA